MPASINLTHKICIRPNHPNQPRYGEMVGVRSSRGCAAGCRGQCGGARHSAQLPAPSFQRPPQLQPDEVWKLLRGHDAGYSRTQRSFPKVGSIHAHAGALAEEASTKATRIANRLAPVRPPVRTLSKPRLTFRSGSVTSCVSTTSRILVTSSCLPQE